MVRRCWGRGGEVLVAVPAGRGWEQGTFFFAVSQEVVDLLPTGLALEFPDGSCRCCQVGSVSGGFEPSRLRPSTKASDQSRGEASETGGLDVSAPCFHCRNKQGGPAAVVKLALVVELVKPGALDGPFVQTGLFNDDDGGRDDNKTLAKDTHWCRGVAQE